MIVEAAACDTWAGRPVCHWLAAGGCAPCGSERASAAATELPQCEGCLHYALCTKSPTSTTDDFVRRRIVCFCQFQSRPDLLFVCPVDVTHDLCGMQRFCPFADWNSIGHASLSLPGLFLQPRLKSILLRMTRRSDFWKWCGFIQKAYN